MYFKILLIFLSSIFSVFSNANCFFLVDIGSTGSRLYFYRASETQETLPRIEVLSKTISNVSLAEQSQVASTALAALVTDQMKPAEKICRATLADIPIYLWSTAGMRLLSESKQQAIYTQLRRIFIESKVPFKIASIRTLSGVEEAFYGWIGVNYLQGTLAKDADTSAVLDLGGASFELTYRDANCRGKACYYPKDFKKIVPIRAQSFLGAGMHYAAKKINHPGCMPSGYQAGQQFNYKSCAAAARAYLQQFDFSVPVSLKTKSLTAVSGFYYTMNFFNAVTADDLKRSVKQICEKQNWYEMKQHYPDLPTHYLSQYCFAGVYVTTLLSSQMGLQLPTHKQIVAVNTIAGEPVDWPMGAALALTLKHLAKISC